MITTQITLNWPYSWIVCNETCKINFCKTWYTVISENGPCFSSKEWQEFSVKYDFKHVTSSPEYAQSNGKTEKGVHILKQLLKKAADSKSDPYLALLNYRTSPLECGMAPAEMLMNRKLQTTLPSCSKQKANVKIKQKLKQLKYRQKFYYDRAAKATSIGEG
uniref:Integrase catalytic domain-containing protein n=1 Tax=Cyprinus carpio carpio TaxID=630221 RepID=A0A9J8BEJ1_CYPCA